MNFDAQVQTFPVHDVKTVRIQFAFLQQTAAGHRKIAAAEQEQLAGSGLASMLALMMKAP